MPERQRRFDPWRLIDSSRLYFAVVCPLAAACGYALGLGIGSL
jgi:hypothetical protein